MDIHKTDDTVIRISKQDFRNHVYIDIRQCYKYGDGEFRPTKKGVTFPPDLLDDVVKALQKLKTGVK